ncbi:hypothetical protein M917_2034 [Psychrobacter aquaticus CMS 56]|uniref:Uncharacterized protein n=1 Tax=Psychrobacter aquaticus CMS 56 TaxID=1354303 RepID=U4T890_9GAMM|nr:hypothetical protein M917_2034 [Psychrobacter aquaticus CMS 56]
MLLVLNITAIADEFGKKSKENLLPTPTDDVCITYTDIE